MELTQEQQKLKSEVSAKVGKGLEDQVAGFLKENYELIKLVFPDRPMVDSKTITNQDFRDMAKLAIDSQKQGSERSIIFKSADNAKPISITLDEINQKLKNNPKAKQFLESRGAKNLSELVFTREQINAIADEAGEATIEQAGKWNRVSGAFSWMMGNGARTPAAEGVRDIAKARLKELGKHRPDIKLIIGDGSVSNDGVSKIGDGLYAGAMAGAQTQETKDPLDDIQVKAPDASVRKAVRDKIHNEVFTEVSAKVTSRVNDGINKIRNDGGFMGLIFQIAEFLGLEKFLARLVGNPIPEKTEINALAGRTAASVSDTLTAENFKYKDKTVSQMNPAELKEAVQAQVGKELKQAQQALPSFNDAQLAEVATEVGKSVEKNFHQIPKLPNRAQEVAAAIVPGTLTPNAPPAPTSTPQIPGEQQAPAKKAPSEPHHPLSYYR